MGYHRAGFEVIGVDLEPQPRFPFPFIQADALAMDFSGFDLIHASPPCQSYSAMKHAPNAKQHVGLIPAVRDKLQSSCLPYVIENVVGAELINPICLCGSMFGLGSAGYQLRRHRLFECSFPVKQPECAHSGPVIGVYGGHVRSRGKLAGGRQTRDFVGRDKMALARESMGIDWPVTMNDISQAIPPAYTKFIGKAWLKR